MLLPDQRFLLQIMATALRVEMVTQGLATRQISDFITQMNELVNETNKESEQLISHSNNAQAGSGCLIMVLCCCYILLCLKNNTITGIHSKVSS